MLPQKIAFISQKRTKKPGHNKPGTICFSC